MIDLIAVMTLLLTPCLHHC